MTKTWKAIIVTQPVEGRDLQQVRSLWSFAIFATFAGAFNASYVQLLLIDENGHILFGEDLGPYYWEIGKANISATQTTVDILTELFAADGEVVKSARLVRYRYHPQFGDIVPDIRIPCRIPEGAYWDPLYADLPHR